MQYANVPETSRAVRECARGVDELDEKKIEFRAQAFSCSRLRSVVLCCTCMKEDLFVSRSPRAHKYIRLLRVEKIREEKYEKKMRCGANHDLPPPV